MDVHTLLSYSWLKLTFVKYSIKPLKYIKKLFFKKIIIKTAHSKYRPILWIRLTTIRSIQLRLPKDSGSEPEQFRIR
jgi:hypothetical protein